jgi:succinyl-CoA synthetase alpha subunit
LIDETKRMLVQGITGREAAIAAVDAEIKLTVLVPDRIPVWDAMDIPRSGLENRSGYFSLEFRPLRRDQI